MIVLVRYDTGPKLLFTFYKKSISNETKRTLCMKISMNVEFTMSYKDIWVKI